MPEAAATSLTSLLGEVKAALLDHLCGVESATCADLAGVLQLSTEATRKHLVTLLDDELVAATSVPNGRGRPARHYRLTDRARRLFPTRSAAVADELMEFIASRQGREAFRDYLTWRGERQAANLATQVDAADVPGRVRQLAQALDDAGYGARVTPDGQGFELTQQHCVIHEVATRHPELCATEAEAFARVLGDEVSIRRHLTIANGAPRCVCHVDLRTPGTPSNDEPSTTAPTRSAK